MSSPCSAIVEVEPTAAKHVSDSVSDLHSEDGVTIETCFKPDTLARFATERLVVLRAVRCQVEVQLTQDQQQLAPEVPAACLRFQVRTERPVAESSSGDATRSFACEVRQLKS